jgi:dihydrodipicolinate reductase
VSNVAQLNRIETMVHHALRAIRLLEETNIPWIMTKMEDYMVDFSKLVDAQAHLATEVEALRSVTAGVTTVLQNQSAQLHDLADQIATLKAGSVSQADLDSVVAGTNALADKVDATAADVTAAIKAGTPAAAEPPAPPVAAPADAPTAPDTPPVG